MKTFFITTYLQTNVRSIKMVRLKIYNGFTFDNQKKMLVKLQVAVIVRLIKLDISIFLIFMLVLLGQSMLQSCKCNRVMVLDVTLAKSSKSHAEFQGVDFCPVEIFPKPNRDSDSVKNSASHDIKFIT